MSERKTDDGSIVAVYSDITELKQRETQLAEKQDPSNSCQPSFAKYLAPQVYESNFHRKTGSQNREVDGKN